MRTEKQFDRIATISAAIFLIVGCFWVLRPFLSALVWSAIVCFSTWPIYSRLQKILKGRTTLAATVMTLLISLVIVVPVVLIGGSLSENAVTFKEMIAKLLSHGIPPPPEWVEKIPMIGSSLQHTWSAMPHNSAQMVDDVKKYLTENSSWLVSRGFGFAQVVFQMTAQLVLSIFISFFIYRDGLYVIEKLAAAEDRLAGQRTQRLLDVVGGTVKGVFYGILGTAVVQGTLAGFGLWLAGVPYAIWLGFLTFILSLLPAGPPLVWGGASVWLYSQGKIAWMVFMLIWGAGVVSMVDNFLKPYLISRGSNLPFILVFLGVLGGVMAFGVIGIFVGPTLISVGYVLLREWSSIRADSEKMEVTEKNFSNDSTVP